MHIIVVAEGDEFGGAKEVHEAITKRFPKLDVRSCVLGHIQRGGAPTYADRVLASRLGHGAVEALLQGNTQVMAGLVNGEVVFTPLTKVVKEFAPISADMLDMIRVLSA